MTASANIKIVQDFCADWSKLDPALLGAYLTDDVFYHNMPDAPMNGREAVVRFCAGYFGLVQSVEFIMLNIAETGGVVLTERIDRFVMKSGRAVDLPVMGAFELQAGKITKWRDYYDGRTAQTMAG